MKLPYSLKNEVIVILKEIIDNKSNDRTIRSLANELANLFEKTNLNIWLTKNKSQTVIKLGVVWKEKMLSIEEYKSEILDGEIENSEWAKNAFKYFFETEQKIEDFLDKVYEKLVSCEFNDCTKLSNSEVLELTTKIMELGEVEKIIKTKGDKIFIAVDFNTSTKDKSLKEIDATSFDVEKNLSDLNECIVYFFNYKESTQWVLRNPNDLESSFHFLLTKTDGKDIEELQETFKK